MRGESMNAKEIVKKLLSGKKAEDGIRVEEVLEYAEENSDLYHEIEDEISAKGSFIDLSIQDEEVSEEVADELDEDEEDHDSDDVVPDLESFEVESFEEETLTIESIVSTIKVDDPVRMYLKEIGQIPLLNIEDEKRYANDVVIGRNAAKQLEDVETGELELSDSDKTQLEALVEKGHNGKNHLVEANYRLVVSIAKHYSNNNSNMLLLDLIQEGNMGLMRAVDKFDPELGYKFSTYATWWIRQAITRAVADQARTIRIPVHMVETINKMVRVQRQLMQEFEREPTVEEIAERMGMTADKIKNIQRIAKEPISLEAPVGEEEDSSLGDFISDPNALNPHESMIQENIREALDELLVSVLTDREEKVLRLRYGLMDDKTHTLEEVGKEFGVTRERIRQIESKALKKLKTPARQNKLKEFFTDKR